MRVAPLTGAACHQITLSTTRRTAFWLRVDENVLVPTGRPEAPLVVETAYRSDTVTLRRYLLGKRTVLYSLRFKPKGKLPRFIHRDWYVQAFYGQRIGSARVLYDDNQVRLVGGGKGNAFVFVYLRLGRVGLPPDSDHSTYRSNLK